MWMLFTETSYLYLHEAAVVFFSYFKAALLLEVAFYARINSESVATMWFSGVVHDEKNGGSRRLEWTNKSPESSAEFILNWKKATLLPEVEWHWKRQVRPKRGAKMKDKFRTLKLEITLCFIERIHFQPSACATAPPENRSTVPGKQPKWLL